MVSPDVYYCCSFSLQREGKLTLWNVELCSIVSEAAIPSPGFCGLSVLESGKVILQKRLMNRMTC